MDSKSQDSGVHKQKFSAFRTDQDCPTWGKKIEVLAMKTLLTLTHLKRNDMLVIRSNLVQKDHNLEFTHRLKGLTGVIIQKRFTCTESQVCPVAALTVGMNINMMAFWS